MNLLGDATLFVDTIGIIRHKNGIRQIRRFIESIEI